MAATGEPYSVAARNLGAAEPSTAEPAAATRMAPTRCWRPVAGGGRCRTERRRQRRSAERAGEVIACAARTLAAPSARIEIRADTDLGRGPERAPPPPSRAHRQARGARRQGDPGTGRAGDGRGRAPGGVPAPVRRGLRRAGRRPLPDRLRRLRRRCWSTAAASAACPVSRSAPAMRSGPIGSGGTTRWTRSANCSARPLPAGPAPSRCAGRRAAWSRTAGTDEFTVWIDDEHVRRIQTVDRGSGRSARATKTETVELWDFGVPVDSLDWSRLPSFRTPAPHIAPRPTRALPPAAR